MITFWLLALVLLISAMLLILWPVLNVRKHQAEEDRTALNVALYQERLAELQSQLDQGTLSDELFEQGRLEAERELLEDTAQGAPQQSARLGITLPLIAALILPVAGAGLYMVWGASDQVASTLGRVPLMEEQRAVDALMNRIPNIQDDKEREQAMVELVGRLENIVRMEPAAADVWFFLGRTYLGDQRVAEAVNAFEQAMQTAGRQPEILSQWIQARFFHNGNTWDDDLQNAVDEILEKHPDDATTLSLIGIAGFETGNFNVARDAWNRLLDGMDPRSPSAASVLTGIERAEQAVEQFGEQNPAAQRGPVLPALPDKEQLSQSGRIRLEVTASEELIATLEPDAAVFVFARSPQAGQIPVAAQRLTVAELPAVVELSDADAVMGEYRLSLMETVEVQASVAPDGDASAPAWVSEALAAEAGSEETLQLLIAVPMDKQAATQTP